MRVSSGRAVPADCIWMGRGFNAPALRCQALWAKDNSPMIHHGVAVSISAFEPLARGDRTLAEVAGKRSFVPNGTFRSTEARGPRDEITGLFSAAQGAQDRQGAAPCSENLLTRERWLRPRARGGPEGLTRLKIRSASAFWGFVANSVGRSFPAGATLIVSKFPVELVDALNLLVVRQSVGRLVRSRFDLLNFGPQKGAAVRLPPV
jgi:hypothetical protein